MLLQCRNQSPDLGNNLYAPAENRKQRVRQIAELRESLGPSLLLRMRIFLGKMLPLELKTPSWHHTRAKALTHPTGQPTVTLHIISARTWHRLRWAWAGRWKPPALSPTGPALHPWSLSETCTSAFAPTGFGIAPSADSQSRGPTSSLGPGMHTPEPHPPCRATASLETRRTYMSSQPGLAFVDKETGHEKREPTRPKPHILSEVKTDPWLNPPPPAPPAPSQKREVCTVPWVQKASLQALPVHTGLSVHTGSRTLAWICFPDKYN